MPSPDKLSGVLGHPYRGLCRDQVPGVDDDAAVPHLQDSSCSTHSFNE